MQLDLIIALVSGGIAVFSAMLAIWGRNRAIRVGAEWEDLRRREERRIESEKVTARFREPLARAAYDLQSRLFNILHSDLFGRHYVTGSERQ